MLLIFVMGFYKLSYRWLIAWWLIASLNKIPIIIITKDNISELDEN